VRTLVALLICLALASCEQSPQHPPQLNGTWTGADWGTVTLDGLTGTYSDTYGTVPGRISLTMQKDGTYSGTWAEGTLRFGTLDLKFEGSDALTGNWKADPKSEKQAKEGGPIRWTRTR
jgi:hypothetical protein